MFSIFGTIFGILVALLALMSLIMTINAIRIKHKSIIRKEEINEILTPTIFKLCYKELEAMSYQIATLKAEVKTITASIRYVCDITLLRRFTSFNPTEVQPVEVQEAITVTFKNPEAVKELLSKPKKDIVSLLNKTILIEEALTDDNLSAARFTITKKECTSITNILFLRRKEIDSVLSEITKLEEKLTINDGWNPDITDDEIKNLAKKRA